MPNIKLSFEEKILLVISSLGLTRMVIAVGRMMTYETPDAYVYLNLIATLIFIFPLVTIYFGLYSKNVARVFSLALLLLAAYAWVVTGALDGMSEYNLMSMLIILATINKGRFLFFIVPFVFAIQVFLIVGYYVSPNWLGFIPSYQTKDILQYQVLMVLLTTLVVYLSMEYHHDQIKNNAQEEKIIMMIEMLTEENERLETQKNDLAEVNNTLEERIQKRVEKLNKSNETISTYLKVNSREMAPSIKELTHEVIIISNEIENGEFKEWLEKSTKELNKAFIQVNNKF